MRVAEERDALRLQFRRQFYGSRHVRARLQRQAIDEIKAKFVEPRIAQCVDGVVDLLERLHAPDRLLNVRIQILNAERHAADARGGIGAGKLCCDVTRIKFDGVPGARQNVEPEVDMVDEAQELRCREHVGRAAAPMHFIDSARTQRRGDKIDLHHRRSDKVTAVAAARQEGVAAAIPTELPAIGDVKVERERSAFADRPQPSPIDLCIDRRVKMIGARIGCVTRRLPLRVGDKVRIHGA